VKCWHCKDFGHAVRINKKCKHNNKNPHYDPTYDGDKARVAAATAPVGTSADDTVIAPSINDEADKEADNDADDDNADAIECNLMDQVGFELDDDAFFDALDEADDYEE